MNAEYQRLHDAARDVEEEIRELQENGRVGSAAELAALERDLDSLSVRLSSLTKAMILLRCTESQDLREQEHGFVASLPHKYHSQGGRRKVVRLPGGVQVTLNVRYFHRQKDPSKVLKKPQRGMFPALMLLGISDSLTPGMRHRIAKASALLGSYAEASDVLADSGIHVSVNRMRGVCGLIGRKLGQLTQGSGVAVAGHVAGRRIAVSLDGGRVRLREPRNGRTKTGRKKFAANWREPRLFIIYAVDEQGRMADDFPPIIDGTLASCDRLFEML